MVRFTVCVVAFALFVGLQSASAQESHPHRIAYVVNGNPCVADAETHKYGCFVNTQPAHVGSMAWSPDGALIAMTLNIFASPPPRFIPTLALFAGDGGALPDGQPSPRTFGPVDEGVGDPVWSPDGAMVAVPTLHGILGVTVADGSQRNLSGPTPRVGVRTLAWSPDGRRFAYASIGDDHLVSLRYTDIAGGSPGAYIEFPDPNVIDIAYVSFSHDGARLLFTVLNTQQIPGGGQGVESQIWTVRADGSDPKMLYDSEHPNGNILEARFSPDGTEIAFDGYADASNTKNVFWMTFDGRDIEQLSFASVEARSPRWRPDGQTLLYVDAGTSTIMQMSMRPRGAPQALRAGTDAEWAPAPGGLPAPVQPGATPTPHPPIVETFPSDSTTPETGIIAPDTGSGPRVRGARLDGVIAAAAFIAGALALHLGGIEFRRRWRQSK